MNIKNILLKIKDSIVSFYTAGTTASYVAIGASVVTGVAATTLGSIALISVITREPEPTSKATIEYVSTTEEETTLIQTTERTTPEITTETTTLETTTEETTTEETTTEETTTPPPTIAVEDLNIGSAEEEATAETTKKPSEEFYEEPTTQKKEPTTEKPTEAPVSEYACVVKGIDVSKWNSQGKKAIDWDQVKKSGVKYVIIRAGYRGQTSAQMYEDPYFKTHIEGALAAGLQVGVYFYSQAITEQEALEEASFLLSIIKNYKLTYPVCFDWEPVEGSRAKDAKLTSAQASAVARKFLSTMEGYGYEAMLYTYHSAIKTYFNTDIVNDYKVWMAWYFNAYKNTGKEYAVGDPLPETNYPYQMWQYSSTGVVPGIQGVVDMNVSFFSYTGSGVPTSAIVLNLPSTSYTINQGGSVDYKTGVKAYNTAGMDVSSSVTITIKNSSGTVVTEADAFNTPGKYTINYTIKDFTGTSKSAYASLTVRANPKITLENDTLTFDRLSTTYADILEAIKNNITSIKDNEGNTINIDEVTITGLDSFYKENGDTSDELESGETPADNETTLTPENESNNNEQTTSESAGDSTDESTDESTEPAAPTYINGLKLGSYEITYTARDSKDAVGTVTLTLILTDKKEDESETESEAESESQSESGTDSESETS